LELVIKTTRLGSFIWTSLLSKDLWNNKG
jgi:hypothetical protein